ncbi:MAG: NAD-dependent epimerase/dehydratase family protein [Limimaricola sp.]|uniref:SDR family oxidoreductase n=1 Tax=Limimaricola sp. TaxID=2211665 RepID=UPI001D2F5441|nr:aldehyde reductase [Limimaricola sp.]MBI1418644.1 NAD-dependent epimerase/dehydratase family protein [Limimaricola sp.]
MTQTVLLTGASGFIAKHVALKLLNAGYAVRGTVRDLSRGNEVTEAVRPHLTDASGLEERLRFVALDLTGDAGWDEAMEGVDAVLHTASPFPLVQPKDENALIRPAVDGALRALKAAHRAGIGRVVLTSSVVAVQNGPMRPGMQAHDEEDWTDLNDPRATAYAKSKTMAERAAWDYVGGDGKGIALTTINPVLVLGPPLDRHYGTSVGIIERILRGKDPMLPRIGFSVVDVRDVAEMHLRALQRPETAGQRFIASAGEMWFSDLARAIKAQWPARRVVTREAPNLLIRALALVDPSIRTILPNLGEMSAVSNARARSGMGMEFIDPAEAVRASAAFLIENGQ